ncbi:tripartite tricarboxylate transporter substrate binding protein [Gracilibacillus dipsosauri]|uniref:tripartite tricarboxylate transporter substrate binding protein n=1 Tax=Gracilibacillus dipsosauri TaxID=178340 RepID=UPI002409E00F
MKKALLFSLILLLSVFLIACNSDSSSSDGGNEGNDDNGGSEETGNTGDSGDSGESSSSYPEKPIQVVVPAGAGGDTDRNSRITAKYLSEELGEDVVVSNVSGAGGTVGAKQVLDAEADGYTVLAFHNSMIINGILELADFDYQDYELAGVAVSDLGNAFIVNAESEFTDLQSLIDAAKERPGEITIATETGAFTHLQLLAFQEETGTEFNIVDIGSASEKVTALLGGQIDIVPTQLGLVMEYIESGDFRSIGIMAEERLPGAPDVPTFKEQGVEVVFDKFYFWAFPKGTPQDVVDTFSKALENVTNNPDFQAEMEPHLVELGYIGPDDLANHFAERTEQYTQLNESAQ